MIGRPDAPLFATINVTTACNLDCDYCFMSPRSNEYMRRPDFERVLDELAELSVFFVNISGGEPFMHPEIGDFLRMAHDRFRHVMPLTNGTILRAQHQRAIDEILQRKGAFTIQVSLDSVVPAVNAVTRTQPRATIRNIRTLTSMGVHVVVATVVTRANVDTLFDTLLEMSPYTRYFHLMTVQEVRMVPGVEQRLHLSHEREEALWSEVHRFGKAHDLMINTPKLYEGYRGCATGAPCMAAFSHIVIDPSLKVRPCDRLVDVFIGDLRRSTIAEIWRGDRVGPILASPVPFCRLPTGMPRTVAGLPG